MWVDERVVALRTRIEPGGIVGPLSVRTYLSRTLGYPFAGCPCWRKEGLDVVYMLYALLRLRSLTPAWRGPSSLSAREERR